jgi:AraC-like DNA-binding protein
MNTFEYQLLLENKVHTGDFFPYNTYICTIPLDFSCVPIHWHDEIELIVIKKGNGYVSIDLKEYPVCAGDIFVVLPGKLHSIYEKVGFSMEYENIIFRRELLRSTSKDMCSSDLLEPLFDGKVYCDCYIHSSLRYYHYIHELMNSIDDICSKQTYGYQLFIKGALYQFFYLLISNQSKNNSHTQSCKNLDKLKLVIKYVEEHYNEDISMDDMAKLCFFSKSHFMKFFKQQMNESFVHYLNNYRLTIASRLLGTTSDSVLNISESVGFNNLSYFNRIFKKWYGITPRQMRA